MEPSPERYILRNRHYVEIQEIFDANNRNLDKAFIFVILEECESYYLTLNKRELYWWEKLKPKCWRQKPRLIQRYSGGNKILQPRKCRSCSKTFQPKSKSTFCCSKVCASKSLEVEWLTKTCIGCEVKFQTKRDERKFCSTICYHNQQKAGLVPMGVRASGKCDWCQQSIPKNSSRRRYCGEECSRLSKQLRILKIERNGAFENVCTICNMKFLSRTQEKKTCSSKCMGTVEDIEKECEYCKCIFQVRHNDSKRFCSKRCAYDGRSRAQIKCFCEQCKSDFIAVGKIRKFCSAECRMKAQKAPRVEISCLTCSEKVLILKSDSNKKFCSVKCWRASQTKGLSTCFECKIEFRKNNTEQKYCSVSCLNKARNYGQHFKNTECPNCKKIFFNKHKKIYCSRQCYFDFKNTR